MKTESVIKKLNDILKYTDGTTMGAVIASDAIKSLIKKLEAEQKLQQHGVMQGQRVLMWLGQWRDKLPIEAIHALQDIVSCPTVGKAGGDASVSDGK